MIISARPNCNGGTAVSWTDRIRTQNVRDGLSKTAMIGEKHVPIRQIGKSPKDGPIYSGQSFHYASRVLGPKARLAFGASDNEASEYCFGSWHTGVCHFAFGDASVRAISTSTDSEVLTRMANRHDGE